MSNIDKKTLAGLLVGIGAFALAAKRGNAKSGSSSWFPQPTGKVTKGVDEFTREQDEVYFSFRQNAPNQPTTRSEYFVSENAEEDKIAALQQQKSSRQETLQQLKRSLSQDTFGDATAIAQMQNEVNSIQAQIDNASGIIEAITFDTEAEPGELAKAQAQLVAAQQGLNKVIRVLPQAQKSRMQAQVVSISAQVSGLQTQIDEAKGQLASIEAQTETASKRFGEKYTIQEYFNEFTERGWDADSKARYGTEADAKFDAWKASVDGFGNPDSVIGKFDGTSDTSDNLSGIGFKDGIKDVKMDDKRFSGQSSSNPFASSFTLPTLK